MVERPASGRFADPLEAVEDPSSIRASPNRFARQKVRPFISTVSRDDLLVLKELIEAGKVTPVIDRTYPFNEIPDAVRYVEAGRAQGKVVISVMDPG